MADCFMVLAGRCTARPAPGRSRSASARCPPIQEVNRQGVRTLLEASGVSLRSLGFKGIFFKLSLRSCWVWSSGLGGLGRKLAVPAGTIAKLPELPEPAQNRAVGSKYSIFRVDKKMFVKFSTSH